MADSERGAEEEVQGGLEPSQEALSRRHGGYSAFARHEPGAVHDAGAGGAIQGVARGDSQDSQKQVATVRRRDGGPSAALGEAAMAHLGSHGRAGVAAQAAWSQVTPG